MNGKPHLSAQPANEGARRLAWLLCDSDLGTIARKRLNQQGCGNVMIDRLLAGEITPGLGIGTLIHIISEGAIVARHWNGAAQAWWFDRPEGWPDFGVLATSERRAA